METDLNKASSITRQTGEGTGIPDKVNGTTAWSLECLAGWCHKKQRAHSVLRWDALIHTVKGADLSIISNTLRNHHTEFTEHKLRGPSESYHLGSLSLCSEEIQSS